MYEGLEEAMFDGVLYSVDACIVAGQPGDVDQFGRLLLFDGNRVSQLMV